VSLSFPVRRQDEWPVQAIKTIIAAIAKMKAINRIFIPLEWASMRRAAEVIVGKIAGDFKEHRQSGDELTDESSEIQT